MVIYKKKITQILLGLEIIFFCVTYLFAKNGLPAIRVLTKENKDISAEIAIITQDLEALEHELIMWHKYPYYREKVAREQLHMSRKDEIIYGF